MVEHGGSFPYEHHYSVTTVIGTQNGTILGPVPPQYSEEITEVVVAAWGGSATGRLMQFATLQGYSGGGTTSGTIVEPFAVSPQSSGFIDGNGAAPIAYVSPGNILYGVVDYGSVLVKVVHRPIYRRG